MKVKLGSDDKGFYNNYKDYILERIKTENDIVPKFYLGTHCQEALLRQQIGGFRSALSQ